MCGGNSDLLTSSRYYSSLSNPTLVSGEYEPETRVPKLLKSIGDTLARTLGDSDHLGIFLSHSYTITGLLATNLKGPDKLLYEYLVERGVPVSLIPVIASVNYECYDGEEADGYDFDYGDTPECPVRMLDEFTDPRIEAHNNLPSTLPFVTGWKVNCVKVREIDIPCAHTGNECEPHRVDKVYVHQRSDDCWTILYQFCHHYLCC